MKMSPRMSHRKFPIWGYVRKWQIFRWLCILKVLLSIKRNPTDLEQFEDGICTQSISPDPRDNSFSFAQGLFIFHIYLDVKYNFGAHRIRKERDRD